jgi:hypothetical protein
MRGKYSSSYRELLGAAEALVQRFSLCHSEQMVVATVHFASNDAASVSFSFRYAIHAEGYRNVHY